MRVRWTEPAIDDLTTICDYIDSHSGGSAARRVALSIHRQIDLLATFPDSAEPAARQARASWYSADFHILRSIESISIRCRF